MLANEDSCIKPEAEKWLPSFISLASWAVAAGTARCEVLKEWVKCKRQAHIILCTTYSVSHSPSQVSPTQIFTTKLRFKHMALETDPEAWPVCQVQNCQYQFSCYVCAASGCPLLVLSGSLVSGVLSRNILSLVYLEHIPKFTFWCRMKQGP